MDLTSLKYLVVGAGFFGSVIAERIASELGEKVLVIDRRPHFGGNSYSEIDSATGIEVHKYGSHIFHTSNEKVVEYLRRFTSFNTYQHRVLTKYQGQTYTMPINLMTINRFYGRDMGPDEARQFMEEEVRKTFIADPRNLEEKAISLIGKPLYDAFIRGYTLKQWDTDPRELPASVITRLPVRWNFNDRYFSDSFEGQPLDGYGRIFERILSHPNIEVRLNTDFFAIRDRVPASCRVIYTGPIDRYFDYRHGVLQWRTCDFEVERLDVEDFQGTSVMNYADASVPFTRIHEFKHFHAERPVFTAKKTVIFREYSRAAKENDTPYYPVNTARDREILRKYQEEAAQLGNVVFGGRLGNYVYIDMHQAIAMALNTYQTAIRQNPVQS